MANDELKLSARFRNANSEVDREDVSVYVEDFEVAKRTSSAAAPLLTR